MQKFIWMAWGAAVALATVFYSSFSIQDRKVVTPLSVLVSVAWGAGVSIAGFSVVALLTASMVLLPFYVVCAVTGYEDQGDVMTTHRRAVRAVERIDAKLAAPVSTDDFNEASEAYAKKAQLEEERRHILHQDHEHAKVRFLPSWIGRSVGVTAAMLPPVFYIFFVLKTALHGLRKRRASES